ncbi:MAG: rRNA maturation RNase YbeY [Bacilli bacterium]|jgi:probable rRNA maturation factor|nr:rRNA maturation RNase YbeY [Bacilli bacterium]MDD3348705.1 rRNA maturation RNase YbeY [Bacilli bacterium]MDD4056645.1 rRNA maturation RNase YbeY [Bacilli bacterium]MDY0208921.1 rRNA maturation RNase YbeY [Bacilli bacterium]
MKINLFVNYLLEITFDYQTIIKDFEKELFKRKEISLVLVDLEQIRAINNQYRNIDRVTDVISFEETDEEDANYLGDVFICVDKVYEQAQQYNHSVEREFAFLLVHGILHLSGFDHQDDEAEKKMFLEQEKILEKLNYRRT